MLYAAGQDLSGTYDTPTHSIRPGPAMAPPPGSCKRRCESRSGRQDAGRSAHARDRIISLHTGEAILQTETHRASLSDHPGELQQVLACAEANSRMYTIDSAACASPPFGSMCRMKRCMHVIGSYHRMAGRTYHKLSFTIPHKQVNLACPGKLQLAQTKS